MKQDTVTGQNHGENYCYYYLHTNGDLIHKGKHCDISDFEESDFVKKWWLVDLENRLDAYNMLIHASMLGIRKERLNELVNKWKITDEDAVNYCDKVGLTHQIDGSSFCVYGSDFINPQESNQGFSDTSRFEAICNFMEQEVNK